MNRYSKIKLGNNTHKSRSMDFSDLHSFHEEKFTMPIEQQQPISPKTSESNQIIRYLPYLQEEEEEKGPGNNNGHSDIAPNHGLPKLTRNGSVSSSSSSIKSASKRFRLDTNSPRITTMQSVVKRAFSMRRSSSVSSERYCRIHDQCVTLSSSPLHDDDNDDDNVEDNDVISRTQLEKEKERKKKKQWNGSGSGSGSGRLFKACKKILRL